MDSFGHYIRQERNRQGLSLEQAAVRIGISKSRLRELETGLSLKTGRPTSPTDANVEALARGLRLDRNHLAALAGRGYRLDPASEQESALLALFRSLPPERRIIALDLLGALRRPQTANLGTSSAAEFEPAWESPQGH